MRRKSSGFTLIEIIVAIGLIGIISAGFLGAISNNYQFLFETKSITEKAFLAQKDMEIEIDAAKTAIASVGHGGLTLNTMSLFDGVTVSYYALENTLDGNTFYTYISDQRLPSIEKLEVSNVAILPKFNSITTKYLYPVAESNLKGTYINDPTTISDLMVNLFSWYVSKPGFNIPVPKGNSSSFYYLNDMPEIEVTGRYPIFPNDFYLIATETTDSLPDLTGYGGRQLLLTVTPAAKSGKIGNPGMSSPVHINGLPDISSLVLHLDASYVDPYNSTEVLSSTNRLALRWYDLDSNTGLTAPTEYAVPTSTAKRPLLKDTDVTVSFDSRFMEFTASKDMQIASQGTNGQTLTYYAIARGRDSGRDELIFTNGSYTARMVEDVNNNLQADGWYLVTGSYLSNSNTFTFGNDNIDIAEIAFFNGSVDDSAITDYFKLKYIPVDSDATIVNLYDQTDEVFVGEAYTLPSAVMAEMSVGSDKLVRVTWSDTVNTSTAGVVRVTGTSIDDPSKTMTLTVTVKPIVYATDVNLSSTSVNLLLNQTTTLTAEVVPSNANDTTIVWSSSNSSVASVSEGLITANALGTAVITATSGDGHASKSCTVTVTSVYNWPSGEVLHLDASFNTTVTGTTVTSWNNIASSNNNFTQVSSSGPQLVANGLNGFSTLRFNGSKYLRLASQWLTASSGSDVNFFNDSASTPYTVFIVAKSATTSNSNEAFFSKATGYDTNATYYVGSRNRVIVERLRGATNITTISSNNFNLIRSSWNNSAASLSINGTPFSPVNTGSRTNQTNFITIGAADSGSSNLLNGDIAEIYVFNRALTGSEITTVEDYLNAKWFNTYGIDWQFTSSNNNWTFANDLTNQTLSNGTITGTIVGADPSMVSATNLNVNLSNNRHILIRMKNNTSSTQAQIYFATNSSASFDENKVVNFTIKPNSEYCEYLIDMSANINWTGTLRQLRLDPSIGATGTFSVDYIRVLQ